MLCPSIDDVLATPLKQIDIICNIDRQSMEGDFDNTSFIDNNISRVYFPLAQAICVYNKVRGEDLMNTNMAGYRV